MRTRSSQALLTYTAAEVRALDATAINDVGIPGYTLMCSAAAAAWQVLRQRWPAARRVCVVCGTGNNGGDGLVMARLARAEGFDVTVLLVGDQSRIGGDARRAYDDACSAGVMVQPFEDQQALAGDVIVDALLGTGLSGQVRSAHAAAIAAINASSSPVLAVDIPSGLCSDSGRVLGAAVRADVTVTFIGCKRGLFTGAAADYCGELMFADLGVPASVFDTVSAGAALLALTALPPRPRTAHKGHAGHVLVVGGDVGMGGAALMAAQAAARCGAGLVSLATRAVNIAAVNARCPEIMAHGVESIAALAPLLERADVVVAGPGLGRSAWSTQMFSAVCNRASPTVLDADGLNLLAASPRALAGEPILTPHPGEAARLLGISTAEINADRFAAVAELAARFSASVVLKGAGSLVAASGERTGICTAGNPGMASGGMGDILSGVIGALRAQGLDGYDAAALGVCAHASAADLAVRRDGERGLLATDLLPWIRRLLNGVDEPLASGPRQVVTQ